MCLDFRAVNTHLKVDTGIQPLPRLDELVEKAAGNKYYATLDLKDAYYQFGQRQVKFLGHIVLEKGIEPDPENVEAVTECKTPTNVKQIRQFLGMCGFYRKHVSNFAKITYPITELTKKQTAFAWTDECQAVFETLKRTLASFPVL
ncbi:uncharacterized mitochondrial protein AtMg00860-like, partial [Homarus americanus]|uniref:uncharacterized mitochondrial protein AtMg00860-like n=1 Tax=Homarus americanus TaxID=6706 RepID=UPI001C481ABA